MDNKTIQYHEALADYIEPLNYGTIVHYQEIERIVREKYGSHRYYRYISKAKKLLEARGKMIQSIGKGDYQILYPGDYSGAYVREVKLAKKRIKHGGKILKGAPVNDMTQEELTEFNNISDFHARMEASICGQHVEAKRLASKKHPLAENVKA